MIIIQGCLVPCVESSVFNLSHGINIFLVQAKYNDLELNNINIYT